MSVFWITAGLLSFSLLAAGNTGTPIRCIDMHTPVRRGTAGGVAFVSCPNVTGDEVDYHLYRCEVKIREVKTNRSIDRMENGVEFQDRDLSGPARFGLRGLLTNSTGLYSCNAVVLYPPPYLTIRGMQHVVLVAEVPQMVQGCQLPIEDGPSMMWAVWVWVALGVAMLYILSITGIAVALWQKQRNKKKLQHDYMNMKPRVKTKKQGVQHPTRLGRY